jgi:hypothetical protein
MSARTRFQDLGIGESFHFSRNPESGLLADLDRPGLDTFRKVSARTYECVGAETSRWKIGERSRVGSIKAKVWREGSES